MLNCTQFYHRTLKTCIYTLETQPCFKHNFRIQHQTNKQHLDLIMGLSKSGSVNINYCFEQRNELRSLWSCFGIYCIYSLFCSRNKMIKSLYLGRSLNLVFRLVFKWSSIPNRTQARTWKTNISHSCLKYWSSQTW